MYIFKFSETSGCSYTQSDIHKDLPLPIPNTIQGFTDLHHTFAGTKCFFFRTAGSMVEDGKLDLFNSDLMKCHRDLRSESDRTNALVNELRTWSTNNDIPITVNTYCKDTSCFTQFTGGGDSNSWKK